MTEMRAMGKEQSSPMNMPPAGLHREKHLSSQSETLGKLARPLHCLGCSLAGLSPGLLGLQAKLVVGPADDEYEREADRVAEQAVSMPEGPVQRTCPSCDEDGPVQREPLAAGITPLIQRQAAGEEDEKKLQTTPMVQRQIGEKEEEKLQTAPEVAGSKGGPAGPELEQSLDQARAGGRPLAEGFRGRMESAFGADFSSVRIHADEPADRLSRSIQARAFTRGQDIFLRQGEYQPASSDGQRLLAHELTHVVQQNGVAIRVPPQPLQKSLQSSATKIPPASKGNRVIQGMGKITEINRVSSNEFLSNLFEPDIKIDSYSPKTLQRHIHWVTPPGQFQIDHVRPGWMDGAGALVHVPGLTSRNHIIDFENIQNDLAIILNNIVVGGGPPAHVVNLINFTNALVHTPGVAQASMFAIRATLIAALGPPVINATAHIQARLLLSRLNSSPDNVRVGNAAINTSIGQNIDADFTPGIFPFAGGMVRTAAAPAGALVAAQPVLTLTPASNLQVYRYQEYTTQMISFVINPVNNRQLSSGMGPTVGALGLPYPVLVTDPALINLPYLYQ